MKKKSREEAYDEWMDSLPMSQRNKVLEGQRLQEEGKQPFWKGVIAIAVRAVGLSIYYTGRAISWLGEEIQSLANRL